MNQYKTEKLRTYAFITLAIGIFTFRLFYYINKQAVNILFFDQWDFLTPLFDNPSLIEMFTKQHGPHRQGLGLFISLAIGELTSWNTRAESFGIGVILVLSTIVFLFLKKRLSGSLNIWDILIPAIVLSPTQLEAIVLTPNPAHGAIPLLLLALSCIILTLENPIIRCSLLVFIGFLATYTGFGFFLGFLTPVLLFIYVLAHWINGEKKLQIISGVSLVISIIAFASFFFQYQFSPAQDCFQFPDHNLLAYVPFISLELAFFVGFYTMDNLLLAKITGFLLLLFLITATIFQIYLFWKKQKIQPKNIVILLLISFSLLFAVNAAVGRICGGLGTAQTSRYMPLLIPGFLGIYFTIQDLPKRVWLNLANSLLVVLFIFLPALKFKTFNDVMNNFTHVKKSWAVCYVKEENIEVCNQKAGNVIYPAPEATNLKEKLDLLKEKKYNLFFENER